jgi:hypothetical protein
MWARTELAEVLAPISSFMAMPKGSPHFNRRHHPLTVTGMRLASLLRRMTFSVLR